MYVETSKLLEILKLFAQENTTIDSIGQMKTIIINSLNNN